MISDVFGVVARLALKGAQFGFEIGERSAPFGVFGEVVRFLRIRFQIVEFPFVARVPVDELVVLATKSPVAWRVEMGVVVAVVE